ncbi:hypothetical protein XELAEV_18018471mg [Xenopus laevis]|uniref:Uncharacterized protein n=1 Tax=Xenopus laevis TaxID=8355 RepID=A0A974DD20_XENLA|nr:hypothetical protein XELAEV_18018471mg [Xenopus laevis]
MFFHLKLMAVRSTAAFLHSVKDLIIRLMIGCNINLHLLLGQLISLKDVLFLTLALYFLGTGILGKLT